MGLPAGRSTPQFALASLIQRELGITVAPEALRMFIRAHWKELSGLAHDIHGSARDG